MFKKKFRSLAIVALSFLMVVSFGVGISTFDTKYTPKAQAVTYNTDPYVSIVFNDWNTSDSNSPYYINTASGSRVSSINFTESGILSNVPTGSMYITYGLDDTSNYLKYSSGASISHEKGSSTGTPYAIIANSTNDKTKNTYFVFNNITSASKVRILGGVGSNNYAEYSGVLSGSTTGSVAQVMPTTTTNTYTFGDYTFTPTISSSKSYIRYFEFEINKGTTTFEFTPSYMTESNGGTGRKFSLYAIEIYSETGSSTPAEPYAVNVSNNISNGTVTANPTSAAEGDTVNLTATPSDGYQLETLTVTKSSGGTVSTTPGADNTYTFTMPSEAVTVSATFTQVQANTYTVTLHENEGSYVSDYTEPTSYTPGTALTLPTENNITREGYTFGGWFESSDFSGTAVTSIPTTATGDKTYYAKWTANTYTIKFHAGNGGTGSAMADLPMTYDTAKNLTANTYEHATLHFAGWDTDESADTVVYTDGQSVNNLTATQGGIVDLYAVWANTITASWTKTENVYWTANTNISETLVNEVGYIIDDQVLASQNGITITAKAGQTGINTVQDDANEEICIAANATNAIEIILPEGFSGTIIIEGSAYSKGTRTATLTKTGVDGPVATLSFTNSALDGSASEVSQTVNVTSGGTYYLNNTSASDKTLYIHSITVEGTADEVVTPTTYTVTYNKNTTDMVEGMPSAATGVSAGSYTLSTATPIRTGYTFKGWATSSDSTSTVTSITVAGDETVYAVWEKDEVEEVVKTIISVDAPSGDYSCFQNAGVSAAGLPSSVTGNWTGTDGSSGAITVPVTWTLDTSSTGTKTATGTLGAVDGFVLGVTTVTASVTVNALPANTVTLTFKNGDTILFEMDVEKGTKPTRPTDPTNNEALWFGGWWTKDGTQSSNWGAGGSNRGGLSGWGYAFDFDKELNAGTTVYAMWVNTMDANGFQTYIDGLVRSGLIDPYCNDRDKPAWNTEGFKNKWHYIDGVFLNSIVNLYYNASDTDQITYTSWSGNGGTGKEVTTSKKQFYYDFFVNYVNDYINDNGGFNYVEKETGEISPTTLGNNNTLDSICESKILYDAYVLTGNEKYLKALETTKDILDDMTKVNGSEITIDGVKYYNYSHQNGNNCVNEIWLDGMYMYAPFLTRYLKATNAPSSDYQELLAQYSFMLKKMRNSETGLYYHAYAGEGNSRSGGWESSDNCSPNFWSRGMGWFVTSLIDVIELMPDDVPVAQGIIDRIPSNFSTAYGNTIDTSNGKAFLQSMLKDAIDALLAHQDPNSKMIYQIIDGGITVDGRQNYLESSGSSMVAYAIMKASRLFLSGQNSKDGRSYAIRGKEMFEGITAHSLYNNQLHDICKMCDITDNGATVSYYLGDGDTAIVKDESKGSAPYMMAFIEYNALINGKTPTPTKTPDVSKRRVHVYVGDKVYFVEVTKGGTTSLSAVQTALANAGYTGTINGLYTDVNCTSQYGYSAVSTDTFVYALESLTQYNVTFNANGNSVIGLPTNGSYNPLPSNTPTRSGYVFKGWATSAGGDVMYAPGAGISGDLTLYAVWVASYTVTFDSNGGSNVANATVESGDTVTKPTDPTLSGYTFAGWYSDSDLEDAFDFSTEITGDTILYAKWTKSTTAVATYTFDKGTNAGDWTITKTHDSYSGSFTNSAYNNIPVKDGYMFGASTASEGNKFVYLVTTKSYSNITKISLDLASTDKSSCKLSIEYSTDGNSFSSIVSQTSFNDLGANSNKEWGTYTKTLDTAVSGYIRFSFTAGGSNKHMAIDNINITYGTSGDETDEYTVTYDDGVDGENILVPSNKNKFTQGTILRISDVTPSREGYTFAGWTSSAFNGTKQAGETFTMPASAVTITANWTEDETPIYTVNYDLNDGSWGNNNQQTANSANISLYQDIPLKTGYSFLGWALSDNATIGQVYYSIGDIEEGVTFEESEYTDYVLNLYAVWTPITITITFDAGDGAFSDSTNEKTLVVSYGSSDDITSDYIPTRADYTFAGWKQDGSAVYDKDGKFVYSAGSWNFTGDKTLNAVWEKIPTYSVTFNVNYPDDLSSGVSGMPENVTDTTNKSVTPSSPSLDGYTFLGWSEDKSATSATYVPGASIDITGNPVLYAIWQADGAGNTVTVNYNFDELQDGNGSYNLNNGGNVTVDGNKYTGKENAYTYTKVATNGVLLSSSEVSRVNYNLVGWATTQGGEKVYDAGGTYTGNDETITLYPVWEISGNTSNRTTTTLNGEIETHVWSAYVVNGAYDANNAESFYYMGTDNGAYKNIRWTDLYKNNVVGGVYTISGGGANDNYSIKVDTGKGASVDADHRMVSEPFIKIDKTTSSATYSPIEIVIANGYTANIKVYAVVYNRASQVSILASDKSIVGSATVSSKYGNTNLSNDSAHTTVNDFVGGVNPDSLTVSGLRTGTYYIANTGAYESGSNSTTCNHIYITGIEISLTPAVAEQNVNFYTNESESDDTIFATVQTLGGKLVLPNTNPEREGYTFDGWYTARSDGEKVTAGVTITENTSYYAQWTKLPTYSVNFEESYPQGVNTGIKNMPEDIEDTTERSITPTSPSLAGYTFKGWSTTLNDTTADYAPGESIDITGSPTLYPVWEEIGETPTETVNFTIYKNGVRGVLPNDYGITYKLVSSSSKTESSGSISIDNGTAQQMTYFRVGKTNDTNYISITVPSSIASSFKVTVIGSANSSNADYSFWLSKTRTGDITSDDVAITSGKGYATMTSGTSGSFVTSDENGDITYYLNASTSSRIYEISLELTKEVDTNVERTISFVTDDNDLRPFEDDIPDAKVTNGESFSLAGFVPTTSSQGYEFSHWEDSLGNVYGNSIESVLRDMTLYAKWFTIASSADTPVSTRGKVPRADAQVYGLYLPSTTTVRLANGSTVSWSVDWDYINATYATVLDGDYTAKNISNYQNIDTVGFYKVKGYITVLNGYRFYNDGNQSDEIVVESTVEVYVIGAQVMAGAGYMSDGRTAWNSGLTLTNDRYTLSENGEVSIVVDADNIGEITNDGIINLTGETFSNSTYKNDAPIEINLPSTYSMLLIVIKVTNATSNNVSLWTEDGRSVPLSQTVGATYTNLSISTTTNYGSKLYLFSSGNNTELHSIVVNAQYEDTIINEENLEEHTNQLHYYTVINDNNSYGEAIEEPYHYLNGAKVIVKPQTEHLDLPDHYLFSKWATATSGTASYYNPGDVLTVTSETNNLYVIMDEEPMITITFDVNAPAGMTNDQISQIFGSFTLEYKIYSGDKLDSIPNFSEVEFTVNDYEYTFDGWAPNITQDTTFNEDTTITANWHTDTLPVIVNDLEKTVQEGTTENEIINSLPTEFVVCDIKGNETSDYDYAVIADRWTKVTYNANVAAYIFRAALDTAPSGTVWHSGWTGVEIDSQTYDRSQEDEDGTYTYYVYCKVIVVEADAYATYSAEFTAFAYTGSGDHVLYNNNSNTHDKAWSDYYQVATDETGIKGTIVARNGGVKIIADNETKVDGNITAALVDTDYHGQTWSMIKGYHQTSKNAPFIYVVVPKGYASVKIHVYAVRFRASGNDVTLHVGPLNGTKEDMEVTDHSYTETDNETDFNYFYEFSPSYYLYEYSGDGNDTVFTVRNTHNSTNIYLTGIKVEYTMVEDESHIITYHANDGTDNALTREVVYAENKNGHDAIVEKNFFEREGYEFIGWSRTKGSDSIEQNYQVGKSLELDGNITLYAVWQRARALTYYANDGSTDSFTKYYTNGRGPLSENEFDMTAETREDKVFLSWNTQSNGQGDTYYPGDIFNPNASDNRLVGVIPEGTVLYAQWGSGKTLTAKWDAYSSELQAIDTVYTDCSQTFGTAWTDKYTDGKIIAKNGEVLTINASGATAGSNAMSKPMLSLAKDSSIRVNVSGITSESALSIRVSAVVTGSESKIKIGEKVYTIKRKFTDGDEFTPFVADLAIYTEKVSANKIIDITTTGDDNVYIVGISVSVSNERFEGKTLTYNNNVSGAKETYDYLVSGSTIVDINRFHRDGYTFAGWNTSADGEGTAYSYGATLEVSNDTTLYAKWDPITYKYKFISEGVNYKTGEFEFGNYITAPETNPTKQGYIFMGWYLDDGVFQNQADFEKGFAPSFEMIDGDTVYLYAYFVQDLHNKTIVEPNELQDLEKYIVDIMSNVYREEGSTSGTARVSASALGLPATVTVTDSGENGTFSKSLTIDWSLAVNGWTLSSLQSGTQTLTGYIILDKDDYNSFAFSDGVNDNLQQIGITVDLTLRNIIIQFNNNEPLAQKNFYYPVGTKRTAVVSQFEVKGFYLDRSGLRQEWIPTGLVWATSNYDSEEQGEYSFTTDLYADIGYAFQVRNDDVNEERKTIQAIASVTLQGNDSAYSGVGFERKSSSDWTNGVTGDFVIDSNGEVGNRLVLTGLSNSYGNENGYLTLDAGENALKISIPSGTEEITISYIGGVRTAGASNTFSIVDANGNVLSTTDNLGAYQSAELASFTISASDDNKLSSLTELYVKVNGDEILLSQILVTSTPVITMSENVVKLRFVYNGVEKYYAIANGDGTISTATKYVKGAKVILPDFDATGLDNRPSAENIEFAGWSNDGGSQVASYMAGGLYDLDTYTDVEVGNVTERVVTLYAVFSIGYHTLTFDSGFGKTVEFKIQIGKTVGEVITIRGTGRAQALKDLEESRVGYNFVDWTYNDEIFSSYTLLDSDVVVTATWTPKTYTINYKNGNEIITTDMVTYTEMFSAPVLDKNPDYINTTRTFRTWTYNGTDWDFGKASLESAGIILSNDIYEIDLQADFGAKVTFKTENEKVVGSAYPVIQDSNVYPIGYRYALTDKFTNLMGYKFIGWSKTENSPTAEFTTESVIELTENITLYAVWQAKDYQINFVSGNDSIEFTDLTVDGVNLENNSALFEFNTKLPNISATASGYVIHSWYYIDEQGVEKTWVFGGGNPNRVIASENNDGEMVPFTLYARWGITVNFEKFSQMAGDTSFNENSATLYNPVVVAIDGVIPFVHTQGTASSGTLHVRPQLPGYSFVGWYKDNQGTLEFDINQAFTIEFINELKKNQSDTSVTIYAGFNKVTGDVTISFVDAFDTGVDMPSPIPHANTSFFTVTSEYILEGNDVAEFVGWSLYPDGSGDIYGEGDEIFIEGDTFLYAFWTITIKDVVIENPKVFSDESIQVQIPYAFDGKNGEKIFEGVFEVKWQLNKATNANDPSDETTYDLTMGAHGVAAGAYTVPVELVLENGYVWAGSNLEPLENGHYATKVIITVLDSEIPYYIVKINTIEESTQLNSDYRLNKVAAEISTDSSATSGIKVMLDVTWNSQIDTTVWGTHYVLGSVLCGSYDLKMGVSSSVSATIKVTKDGTENKYLYKTYQNGKMPDAPTAPSADFEFLCWTDKGVTAVGQNQVAPAGEWTAMYAKLSFTSGASIRLNKDYTGIRFTAHLEFYGVNYVAELMKNKSNLGGAVSVTMNFTYVKDGTTYNVGTGQDFKNMTQSVEGDNAIITFSGVISDLVQYNNNGALNKENCGIAFTPIAKVKLNDTEIGGEFTKTGTTMSASQVAQGVKGDEKYNSYTAEQKAIIDSYDTAVS